MDPLIIGFTSSVLGISCGIIAIVAGAITAYKRNKNSTAIRQAIIENHVDAETAKLLLAQDAPKAGNPYTALFWALALIGFGVGYLFNAVTHLVAEDSFGLWIIMAAFTGIGLLVAFFIKLNLDQRKSLKDGHKEE